jgi:uncharacterized protein YjdB
MDDRRIKISNLIRDGGSRTRLRRTLLFASVLATGCLTTTAVQTVAKVSVTPPTANLIVHDQVTLQASLTDGHGQVLKGPFIYWSSQDTTIAAVSSTGVVTAKSPGRAQIAASADGVSGSATITVASVQVASVAVVPDTLHLTYKTTGQLIATAYDQSGHVVFGLAVAWGSSSPSVAAIDQSGVVTAVGVGTSTVTALVAGKTGSASVIVPSPVASINIQPDTLALAPGASGQLKATAYDASGHVVSGLAVAWGSSNTKVASVDTSGLVTGVSAGTTSIFVAIGGRTASATVVVFLPLPTLIAGCNGGTLSQTVLGDIVVTGNIDNGCQATVTSIAGSIEVKGNINNGSSAILMAPTGIIIDQQIAGGSALQATTSGAFTVAQTVGGGGPGATSLTVFDCDSLGIQGDIHGGAQAKLHSHGPIVIAGQVHDQGTQVLWWAPSFVARGGVSPPKEAVKENWGGFPDQY